MMLSNKITFNNSYIESINGIDYLNLNEKNHYDTGFAAGTLFIKSNYKIIKILKNRTIKLILFFLNIIYKNKINNIYIPNEYKEEMRGYSDSTKISYDNLLLINLIYEIIGCSGFIFFNSDKSLIIGHNTDITKLSARITLKYINPLITKVNIPNKNIFTHVSLPLILGAINGFNDKGIAISSHAVSKMFKKKVKNNISTSCLLKTILDTAENLNDIEKIVKNKNAYNPGITIIASEYENKICILEMYTDGSNLIIKEKENFVFSTNHFHSMKMQKYHKKIKKGSIKRYITLSDKLYKRNQISINDAIQILQDKTNGINRDSHGGHSVSNNGTFQSFILDVTNKNIYISNAKKAPVSLNGEFVKISML